MIKNLILTLIGAFVMSGVVTGEEAILTENQKKYLALQAAEGRQKAYAPYSNYFVGAAVLTADGEVIQGCNIENASYGLANCGERTALFSAIASGKKEFVAIAVSTADGLGSPCGACRQVINEFNPEMIVLLANSQGDLIGETTIKDLLPNAFGPHNL